MPRRKRLLAYPYYELEPHPSWKIPKEIVDLARRRTGGLLSYRQASRPLYDILANAYLLGVADSIDILFPADSTN